MSYLETFLECYYDHVENYEALLFLLSLLPASFQYVFLKNLLRYEHFLVSGDVFTGERLCGVIRIVDDRVVLDCGDGVVFVLLDLPPVHEV